MENKKNKTGLIICVIIILIIVCILIYYFGFARKGSDISQNNIAQNEVNSNQNVGQDLNNIDNSISNNINSENTNTNTNTNSDNNSESTNSNKTENNTNSQSSSEPQPKVTSTARPSGFAGSSMNKVDLYSNGNVYVVVSDTGEDTVPKNNRTLIAKNATKVEETEDGGVLVSGKNINIVDSSFDWITFKKN